MKGARMVWQQQHGQNTASFTVETHVVPCVLSRFSPVHLFVTPCDPPGSSVHGILQARILEWVAAPSSRGSSPPRDGTLSLLLLQHWQAGSLPLTPPGKPIDKHVPHFLHPFICSLQYSCLENPVDGGAW